MRLLPFDYAVRNLSRSRACLIAGLINSALVVALMLVAGGFVRGMEHSLGTGGRASNVILLGAGSEESLERSEIDQNAGEQLASSVPGIRTRGGVNYVSPEVHMAAPLYIGESDALSPRILLRGVTDAAFLVHDRVRIIEGRAPRPGMDEVMVGRLAATVLGLADGSLKIGGTIGFDQHDWTIVGRFGAAGTSAESEIWFPLGDLQIAAKRDNLSCVVATLDAAEFADVDAFCKQRLDLELVAVRERDYYAGQHAFFAPIRAMVWGAAILIGLGGMLGGLNAMYAAFWSRVRELGALQTLGYSRRAIVVSLVQESLLMAALGGLVAAGLGALLLDGWSVRFSMGAFGLRIDAAAMAIALGAGVMLGLIGALPPAWRCLRMPIPDALRTA